ncbi:MAG: energy transducer TonB [Acidobacteria bacterium]|nr:energy transducer TonB [Acidobacteriota bacterium]
MLLSSIAMMLSLSGQGRLLTDSEASALLRSQGTFAYPPLARQARIMGFVRVRVDVGPDGLVQKHQLISGHPLLHGSVVELLKTLRFDPLVEAGVAVGFAYIQEVNFRLENSKPEARVQSTTPPRQECRWRNEDWERASACLAVLANKTSQEYLGWAELELKKGNEHEALRILGEGLPQTARRYLELAESLGEFEEARRRMARQ